MKKIPSILCSLVLIVAGTQAHATWKQIQISGTITNNGGGLLGPIVNVNVGDSFDLSLIVDSADPDTNPATGAYHSLNDALVDTVFIVAIKGKAPVLTTGSTQWLTQGNLDLTGVQPGLYLPFTATLNGTGMTLDQVLPNFTPGSITTSPNDIVVDLTPLWIQGGYADPSNPSDPYLNYPYNVVEAQVVGVTINPAPDTDGDGVIDALDAFPTNPVAAVDADKDGYPDAWLQPNPSNCPAKAYTCNGLTRDAYPANPLKWYPPVVNDVTGDFTSDVLMRNSSTGNWQAATMNNALLGGIAPLGLDASSDNQFMAWGDFDGNGQADLLSRSVSTGIWSVSLISGGAVGYSGQDGLLTSDTNWVLQGVGDFNGDGFDDVLLRNSVTHQWTVYYMSGGAASSSAATGLWTGTAYAFQGAADMNGDGTAEVLLRNTSTGTWYAYNFANNTMYVVNGMYLSSNWQFQGMMDFNGDGKKDVLLRQVNPSAPYPGIWGAFIVGNNFGISGAYTLAGTYLNLSLISLAAIGDFNGDTTDDMLLKNNSSGQYYMFTTNPPGSSNAGLQTMRGYPALSPAPWMVLK